jgi:hypothetical protein
LQYVYNFGANHVHVRANDPQILEPIAKIPEREPARATFRELDEIEEYSGDIDANKLKQEIYRAITDRLLADCMESAPGTYTSQCMSICIVCSLHAYEDVRIHYGFPSLQFPFGTSFSIARARTTSPRNSISSSRP